MKLYVATSNAGKLRDFSVAGAPAGAEILTLPGVASIPAPEESGATFAENARLKAEYYSRFLPGELVLADDSGLEVEILDGQPGVRSARFAEDSGFLAESSLPMDERNNRYLLTRMVDAAAGLRQARYRCVLAVAKDGVELAAADGSVPGEILTAPRGAGGFGYDPLFLLPQLGKTMAEIDLATKLQLSHRGEALRKLLALPALRALTPA